MYIFNKFLTVIIYIYSYLFFTKKNANKLCEEKEVPYIECSAKTGQGVKLVFETAIIEWIFEIIIIKKNFKINEKKFIMQLNFWS